jgi:hypothetical protein
MGLRASLALGGSRAKIFIALRNPLSPAGFEPPNLGTNGKHATTRPPRATYSQVNVDRNIFKTAGNKAKIRLQDHIVSVRDGNALCSPSEPMFCTWSTLDIRTWSPPIWCSVCAPHAIIPAFYGQWSTRNGRDVEGDSLMGCGAV